MGELAGRGWSALSARSRTPGQAASGGWFWHRQLKKPFFGRFMKPWRWPQDVARGGWTTVSIASPSQSELVAIVRETDALRPRGVVVCAHPMGLACKGFWLKQGHADALLAAGFHVVAFDFNGFGDSPSTNFDWPSDVVAVGRWARQRFPGQAVHALTASFGAMNVINAMTHADYPFRNVVAEGCAPNLPMFWKAYPFAHAVLQLGQWLTPSVERRLRPESAIAHMPANSRLLLIHSQGDRWTPVTHGDRLAAHAPASADVRRLTLLKADHTHGMRDEREVYWPAVLEFLSSE